MLHFIIIISCFFPFFYSFIFVFPGGQPDNITSLHGHQLNPFDIHLIIIVLQIHLLLRNKTIYLSIFLSDDDNIKIINFKSMFWKKKTSWEYTCIC